MFLEKCEVLLMRKQGADMKKYIYLILFGLFCVIYFYQKKEVTPSYFEISQDPYWQNPPKTKVDINNINIICPMLHENIGERYMVEDLEKFFISKGKKVRTFDEKEYTRKENFEKTGESANIFIYGWVPFWPNKNGINIIYLLFPDLPEISYRFFDFIATASPKYSLVLNKKGWPAGYIPQFSDPKKFRYEYHDKLNFSALFVGNLYSKEELRPSVKYALENHIDVAVYGKEWKKYIPSKYVKGKYISNDKLHSYYSSADIVLNDHRQDMIENGFISNRIFDVTASGGFIISDYMPEIEEIYGDSIPMYHHSEDFGKIVRYYLDHPEERKAKALLAHKITLENFTVEKIGQKFLDEIDKIAEKRKAEGTIVIDE